MPWPFPAISGFPSPPAVLLPSRLGPLLFVGWCATRLAPVQPGGLAFPAGGKDLRPGDADKLATVGRLDIGDRGGKRAAFPIAERVDEAARIIAVAGD